MLLVPCAATLLCAFGAQGAQGDRPAAQELWERGERRAALELWARELESSPSRELRLALAQHQLLVHAYQAALDSLSALPAGDADARQVRARALYALSRYAEAVPLLDGRDPQQCLLLVDALEALDREDEARAALTLAEEVLGAADPRVLTARGRERARAGDEAGATACFRAALAHDPLAREALFGLGQSLLRQGARDEARVVLERHRQLVPLLDAWEFAWQSLDLEPLSAPNHARIGDLERELARFDPRRLELVGEAYAAAERLARDEELVPIALRAARFAWEDLRDLEQALALLARAEARVNDARLPVRAGDLLLEAARPREAELAFERALRLRPKDAQIEQRLALARDAAGSSK